MFSVWEKEEEAVVAAEVPLLFEAGWEELFDKIVLTSVSQDIQIERIMKKRSVDIETAKKWTKIQGDQDEKMKKANVVVNTEGNIDEVEEIIKKFVEEVYK